MEATELEALRKGLDLTQTETADEMGLSLRQYQDIEGSHTPLRRLHQLAAERVALAFAVQLGNPMAAPASVRVQAIELARIFNGTA